MTRLKKLTALLVSAALALSLLAGCGGSKALSQVIADLLSGMYKNVSVEVDPDLTAALKKAAAAGSTQEEVLAALVEELNLSGVRLTLRQLQEGQQGDRGVELVFQSGADPDAAARSAVNGWASAFGALPDDGSYTARVAMIEAEGGYYIAVDVEVLKAGSHDKDDSDDDKDDEDGEDGGDDTTAYTQDKDENGNITSVTIKAKNGLQQLMNDLAKEGQNPATALAAADITLNCNVTLTGEWTPIGTNNNQYTGTFDGQGHTISGLSISSSDDYVGLFGYVGSDGTVQNLTLDNPHVESTYISITTGEDFGDSTSIGYVGAVAGVNFDGIIENCHITGGTISASADASYVGGVVGENDGSVTGCSSTSKVTATGSSDTFAGGVVGYNGSSVTACCSTSTVTANGSGGGVGGVVGFNFGTVTACYHANGSVSGNRAGGVVGYNLNLTVFGGTVTACYWSGNQTQGIGESLGTSGDAKKVTSDGDTDKDDNTVSWDTAKNNLNSQSTGYIFGGDMNNPTLTKK